MMKCRPTHTLSLWDSLLASLSLTHSLGIALPRSLFFPLSLLSWYLLIKIEYLDISCQSWLKTLFVLMFGKVYIYLNAHPLTRSQQYPPSQKCHINTPFSRVKCQAKKTPKSHANSLSDAIRHCLYLKKKSPAAQASGGSVRLPHSNDYSTPVHNYFLKNLYWTRSQLVSGCSLHAMDETRMIVQMKIQILNCGEILVNCKTRIIIWICAGRYKGIQIQPKSQFEFAPRDTDEFEFFDFD